MFTDIFKDGSLQEYINQNTQDPWVGTNFEGYVFMSPKQKGEFGERFVHKYMELLEYRLERAATSTAGIAAIKIPNMIGATTVCTTRDKDNKSFLNEMGASEVLISEDENFPSMIREVTCGDGVKAG